MSKVWTLGRMWVGVGRWAVVLLIVALALPMLPMTSVGAATRTVDSLSDGAVDAGHCTDAIAGNCTFRDAIAAALPNDTITFSDSPARSRSPLLVGRSSWRKT